MRLFLDSSVLLAACGSENGASVEVIRLAPACGWTLFASPYVIDEVLANLPNLRDRANENWTRIRPGLSIVDDVLTLDQAVVFAPAKDRPILFSALAWADVLLTLDQKDFSEMLGRDFYGLSIMPPGEFLERNARPVD